jgi:hypothetical protein
MTNDAVELEGESVPRRRRPVLAVSGWGLLLCLFLPTLRVCGNPTMPLEFPPSYNVYLGGLVVAVIALARTRRQRQRSATLLISLWYVTAVMLTALVIGSEMLPIGVVTGAVGLALGFLIVRASLRSPPSDRTIAFVCIVHGVIASGWNTLLASDHQAMWGAEVGLGVSLLMVGASMVLFAQEHRDAVRRALASQPAALPVARVVT